VNFRQFLRILAKFRPIKKTRNNTLNSRDEKLQFAFGMYDLNGDKFITKDELLSILNMMVGANITPDQVINKSIDNYRMAFFKIVSYEISGLTRP